VRFTFEQRIDAPRPLVEAAYVDVAFYEALGRTPNLGVREVLRRHEFDGVVELRVRFAFTGSVSAAVRAVVDPAKLTWVTANTIHPAEHRATFEMIPDHFADRLACSGRTTFHPAGSATRQVMEGDLVVQVPFVGRAAEQAILSGFRENLQQQAVLLARWADGAR
jgi:Protein of unknown function (DUF2505)